MALTIVETINAQTTSSTGVLNATFTATPQVGDRVLAFVTLELSSGSADQLLFSVSGLGASWRLLHTRVLATYTTYDWYGIYEAVGVDGVGTTVTASESSSGTTANFSIACFNVRGVPTGSNASAVYGLLSGNNTNPPVLSVTPNVAGDAVMGMWYQHSSATAPTVATVPSSGYSSFSTTMTSMSIHWRYKIAADTTAHTMDSPTSAMYTALALSSQLGPARVERSSAEVLAASMTPVRRYDSLGVEAMLSPLSRKYNQAALEVLVSRIPFKGWGTPL